MSSQFQYGGFLHPLGEMFPAAYTVRTRLSPRGKTVSRVYTTIMQGEIISTTGSAGITTRLNEILAAYHIQNQDALFYVNGSLTPHILPNSNSISGVKVLEIDHPFGDKTEYANRRRFRIVIQSEKEEPESQIFDYRESVRMIGNAGPRDVWVQGYQRPRKVRVCLRTTMMIVQSGWAIGWAGYFLPPGPLLPLSELQDRRVEEYGAPKSTGQAFRLYPSSWSYTHVVDTFTEAFPHVR